MRQRKALTTAVVGLLLVACGEDKTPETLPPTKPVTSVVTTTTTTVVADPVHKEIIDAWIGADRILDEAMNSGEYENHPGLVKYYFPGELFQATKTLLSEQRVLNAKVRYPEPSVTSHDVRVVKIEGITTSITDCYVTDGIAFDGTTDEVLDDKVVTSEVIGELVRNETTGQWRASGRKTLKQLEGVQKCDFTN
ncbi:MAG: hypothetical protein ACSLFB_14435 [Acidimicrobiales bacterium]